MDLDLSPKYAQNLFEGDGGSYSYWSSIDFPALAKFAAGAGKLILRPRGFVFPHFADSPKIGYVLQGDGGLVGMVLSPRTKSSEDVLGLRKGDVISVPLGSNSWWFNGGDSDLIIVFIGKTSIAYTPGEFTYFFPSGPGGILPGFSTEFSSRVLGLDEEDTKSILTSQKDVLMIKLEEGKTVPQPDKNHIDNERLIFNTNDHSPDVSVKNGGHMTIFLGATIPSLGQLGISVRLMKIEPNALCVPMYTTNDTIQVIYVLKGSGKVEIVGLNGKRVLDTEVKEGQLFVVPKFFAVAKLASNEGMECFTVFTSSQPVLEVLGSKDSIWEALSSEAVEATLQVSSEIAKKLKSKIRTDILIPPSTT